VDTNAVVRASLGRDATKNEFASALIYKLQRKKHLEYSNQFNAGSAFTGDESTSFQLLVIWGPGDKEVDEFFARALLIKHNNEITWDEYTLEKLHSMYLALLRGDWIGKDTWLLNDIAVLRTTLRWKKDSYVFEITIS
jgi:hypothetical protein